MVTLSPGCLHVGPHPEVDAALGPKFGAVEVICRLPSAFRPTPAILAYYVIYIFIYIHPFGVSW